MLPDPQLGSGAADDPELRTLGDGSVDRTPSGPRALGEYSLERRLGAGGMGEVYVARRTPDARAIALKTLSRTSATNLYRFKREFRSLADVEHPGLVRLHELEVSGSGAAGTFRNRSR